jgi:putative heme-binding domain-containing protein
VLEAILEPSQVVSDLYAGTVVTRRDGSAVFGRASKKRVDGQEVWEVVPASAAAEPVLVPVADVASTAPSPLSPMPAGLVDGLSATELHDLVRYLRSRGQR